MNRGALYRDTNIHWIGEIPKHWKTTKIKYTTYVKGRIGWQGLKSEEFIEEGPYLVTGTDFLEGEINWDSCYHISEDRYNEAPPIQLKEADLLITKDGTIGKVAIVKDLPYKAILNSGIFVTRSEKYLVDYMYWILNSPIFDKYIKYFETGSTIKHLYQETFENFSYPLPPKSEQTFIVEYLKDRIGTLDNLIIKKNKIIDLLEKQRQSIITETVTKGLNPNVKMKDSGVEWIGDIPEHWEVKKLKHLGKFVSGYAFPSNAFINNGTKVIKINNIQTMNLEWFDISYVGDDWLDKLNQYQVRKGDLVIALTRPIISTGIKAAIVDTDEELLLNQRNAYFRNNNLIPSNWLYYLVLNQSFVDEFESLIDRTGQQPNISTNDIENIKIPLPSLGEIQQITDYLNERTTEIEKIKVNTLNQIAKLKEYRQALIYEAVTGKIDVRDMELN